MWVSKLAEASGIVSAHVSHSSQPVPERQPGATTEHLWFVLEDRTDRQLTGGYKKPGGLIEGTWMSRRQRTSVQAGHSTRGI